MISTLNFQEPTVPISAKDVIPVSIASANLSDLVDEVRDGSEKIITKDGEQCAALISAERLADCRRMELERVRALLREDAKAALEDIKAGRTYDGREYMARLMARVETQYGEQGASDRE